MAASSIPLLCFQTLKIALALASRLGDPVYDSTITESMDDMLRWVLRARTLGATEVVVDVEKESGGEQLVEQ